MLEVVSLQTAKEIIEQYILPNDEIEYVSLENAVGRILAQDVVAHEDVPNFNRSTVDGYAVIAADTYGASESIPAMLNVVGEVEMGKIAQFDISNNQCVKISTGGMLPEGANAVVMLEHTEEALDGLCLCQRAVSPFENVVRKGDDVRRGDFLIKSSSVLTASQIGILCALGIDRVAVKKRVKIGIISTGDELVEIDKPLTAGRVRDINSYLLNACCERLGCESVMYGIVKDDYAEISGSIKKACDECDIVLISGGSSAGARDMTVNAVDELGKTYFHGVAMKPGKPSIFGVVENKAVFGLPGHPLAAFFVFEQLVKYAVSVMNNAQYTSVVLERKMISNVSSNNGREDFVCVKIIDDEYACCVPAKSGIISVLNSADGYITIPRNAEGIKAHEKVRITLL